MHSDCRITCWKPSLAPQLTKIKDTGEKTLVTTHNGACYSSISSSIFHLHHQGPAISLEDHMLETLLRARVTAQLRARTPAISRVVKPEIDCRQAYRHILICATHEGPLCLMILISLLVWLCSNLALNYVHSNDNAILMDNIEVDDDHLMLTNPDTKNLLSTCMNKQMKPF
jgi:hypothetical protein